MSRIPWWVVSLISAVAAMAIFALGIWLPLPWGPIILGVGVVVFVLVMMRNPLYWYRNTAAALLGGWTILKFAGRIQFVVQIEPNKYALLLIEKIDTWDFIVVGIIVVVLLILDYLRTSAAAGQLLTTPGPDSGLATGDVSKRDRAKLLLQRLQGETEFFSVDTSRLDGVEAAKVAIRQVVARERVRLVTLGVIALAIVAAAVVVSQFLPAANAQQANLGVTLPKVGDSPPRAVRDQAGSYTIHTQWDNGAPGDADLYWELLPGGPEQPDALRFDRSRAILLPRDRTFKDFSPPVAMPENPHWRFVLESRGVVVKMGRAEPLTVVGGSR